MATQQQLANPVFNDTRKSLEGSTSSSDHSDQGGEDEEESEEERAANGNGNDSNGEEGGDNPSANDDNNPAANVSTDGSVDDLIIECKVDYYLKDSEDSSSVSDSSDSESEGKSKSPGAVGESTVTSALPMVAAVGGEERSEGSSQR